jgi:hypothetical protein
MLKKILKVSSMAFVLAMGASISANASSVGENGNEEDLSAPVGSFTSGMPAPAKFNTAENGRRWRHDRLALRFGDDGYRLRQNSERQKSEQ